MPEKLLLAVTITFSLNLFLGGHWASSTPASDKAQIPASSSQVANHSETPAFVSSLIKPLAL